MPFSTCGKLPSASALHRYSPRFSCSHPVGDHRRGAYPLGDLSLIRRKSRIRLSSAKNFAPSITSAGATIGVVLSEREKTNERTWQNFRNGVRCGTGARERWQSARSARRPRRLAAPPQNDRTHLDYRNQDGRRWDTVSAGSSARWFPGRGGCEVIYELRIKPPGTCGSGSPPSARAAARGRRPSACRARLPGWSRRPWRGGSPSRPRSRSARSPAPRAPDGVAPSPLAALTKGPVRDCIADIRSLPSRGRRS